MSGETADPARAAHYLQARAAAIQYLKSLEDELIGMGILRPHERACMTRRERKAAVAQLTETRSSSILSSVE